MSARLRGLAALVSATLALAIAFVVAPNQAGALPSAAWVGTAHASAPGTSCLHPGYNSIQAAINGVANGGTVHVCGGRYVEQIQITRPVTLAGTNGPVIALPAVPANSTTPCDTAIPGSYQPNQDAISICSVGIVRLSGLSIDAAWPAGTCYDSMYGIFAAGGVNLNLNYVSITAAGARPINGCQGGIGVEIGSARTSPNETAKLTMTNSSVSGYQKNGINIVGAGTAGHITTTSVTGAGPTDQIAQNGIEVAFGGLGMLSGDTISGNECDVVVCGPDPLNDTQSTGVLFYGAAPSSSLATSTLIANDIGVYYLADPSAPISKTATVIRGNKVTSNRYEGVCLDQGFANVNGNTYSGGRIGLSIIQYSGQTFGSTYSVSNEIMSSQTVAAVEVDSDNAEDDQPGKATLSNVAVHGGAVVNNSSNFVLITHNLH